MESRGSTVQLYCVMLAVISVIVTFHGAAMAQTGVPQFKDFSVPQIYTGKTATLVLRPEDRMFRTRLAQAARKKPNFAGHYILTTWGCGSECLLGAVIDAKTGKVYQWDFSICCWDSVNENFRPVEFRLNSKLVVFSGRRNEGEGDNGAHFYKFENGRFVHLHSILKEEQ